ncbi:hypothetical protein BESB_065450 [Besnoitia besnoiti]|uniref:Protein kinase domain-containing protein n=1 Tax=Besnoitia besnoiti TaxID=94643 RepID=A0A2A9MFS3_BESBE|nr:hypothetical protein BESB_065450 [Besnoitia besnoiti]PFH34513.1 hypothetical protein BESB_065450 [Besnoitia besnoiti]
MRDGRLFLADFSCMKEASGKTRAAKRCPSATMETDVTSLGSVLLELWDISVINVLPTEGEQEPPFRGVAPPSYVVRLIRGFIHHSRSKRVSPMQALTSPEMAQLVEEIQQSPLQYSSQGDSELAEGPPSGDGAGAAGQAASAQDAAASEPLGDTSGDDSDAPTTAAGTAGDIGGASDSQP